MNNIKNQKFWSDLSSSRFNNVSKFSSLSLCSSIISYLILVVISLITSRTASSVSSLCFLSISIASTHCLTSMSILEKSSPSLFPLYSLSTYISSCSLGISFSKLLLSYSILSYLFLDSWLRVFLTPRNFSSTS